MRVQAKNEMKTFETAIENKRSHLISKSGVKAVSEIQTLDSQVCTGEARK